MGGWGWGGEVTDEDREEAEGTDDEWGVGQNGRETEESRKKINK